MADSMYMELNFADNEAKFYEFVAACGLDNDIADVLYGNAQGSYIYVNKNSSEPFAETKSGGILIEIGKDLLDWQTILKQYFIDNPAIINAKMLTKAEMKQELKPPEAI